MNRDFRLLLIKERERKLRESNRINHPQHYNTSIFETIDVIEEWGLGFNLGNAVKYISRAGNKVDISPPQDMKSIKSQVREDLLKAQWYLNRQIEQLNQELEEKEI